MYRETTPAMASSSAVMSHEDFRRAKELEEVRKARLLALHDALCAATLWR